MYFHIILANKSGVLSGMPPGVTPLVGAQYILSQQGIPGYYHQSHPAVMYSEEHLQMVQSRLPHHMVKYIKIKIKNYFNNIFLTFRLLTSIHLIQCILMYHQV